MAFAPVALHAITATIPPSDFLSGVSCSCFIITCSTYSLIYERPLKISRVAVNSQCLTCLALQPRSSSMTLVITHHEIMASRRSTLSPYLCKIISRLDCFNFRLRPVSLHLSCLIFGVTSAYPIFAIRWLTYLAGMGLTPIGIFDLARPHTP